MVSFCLFITLRLLESACSTSTEYAAKTTSFGSESIMDAFLESQGTTKQFYALRLYGLERAYQCCRSMRLDRCCDEMLQGCISNTKHVFFNQLEGAAHDAAQPRMQAACCIT